MKRKSVAVNPEHFPESLRHLITTHKIYDSSCSQDARVWFLDAYGRDRMEPEMLRLIAACEVFL